MLLTGTMLVAPSPPPTKTRQNQGSSLFPLLLRPLNIIAFMWMCRFYVPSAFLRNNSYILSNPKLLDCTPSQVLVFSLDFFLLKYFLSLKIYASSNRIIKWIQYCYKVFVFVLEQLFTYHEILPVLPVFIYWSFLDVT